MQPRGRIFRSVGGFGLNRLEWRSMTALSAELKPHPTSSCDAIRRFGVAIEPSALVPGLRIRFRIEGATARLRLPLPVSARRTDGLWQHTCFEAFLQADANDSYYEFNFAPSGEWAAYRFGGRRIDRTSPEMPALAIELQTLRGWLRIDRRHSRPCAARTRRGTRRPRRTFGRHRVGGRRACPGGRSRTRATSPISTIHRHSCFA